MLLWNAILPEVTGVKTLTYWQAVGLLVLSRILFGGWRGGGKPRGYTKHRPDFRKEKEWREKWMNMSREERMKFRQEWRERCKQPGKWEDWRREKPDEEENQQPRDEEIL